MISLSDDEIHVAELVDDEKAIMKDESTGMVGPLTKVQGLALLLVLLLLSSTVLYSMMNKEEEIQQVIPEIEFDDPAVFVTDSTGASIDVDPIDMTFFASSVGEDAAEPHVRLGG